MSVYLRVPTITVMLGLWCAFCAGAVAEDDQDAANCWRIELAEKLEELSGKPCLMTLHDFARGSADLGLGPFLQPVEGWATPIVRFAPKEDPARIWGSAFHGELGWNDRFRLVYVQHQFGSEDAEEWRGELQLHPGRKAEFGVCGLPPTELAAHTPYLQLHFNPQAPKREYRQWPSFVLTIFTDTGECFYHRFEKQSDAEPAVRLRRLLPPVELEALQQWLRNTAPWCVTYDRYNPAVWPRQTLGWLSFRTPKAIGQMPLPLDLAGPLLGMLHELDAEFWDAKTGASLPNDVSDWSTRLELRPWLPAEEPKSLGRPVPGGIEYAFTIEGSEHQHMAWAEMCLMRPRHPESKPKFYFSDGRLRPGWQAEVIRPWTAAYVRLTEEEYGIAVNTSHLFPAVIEDPHEFHRQYRYLPPPPPTRAQVYCCMDGKAKRIFNEPVYRVNPEFVDRWEKIDRLPCTLARHRLELRGPVLSNYRDMKREQKPALVELRVYDQGRQAFRKFQFQPPVPAEQAAQAIDEATETVSRPLRR